ncbi:MAG: hypothetical protein KDA36_09030 [Planctomycetaceae bacterium]|nr:hypothetical protein [Planctomycetaceae bacterium]
MKPFCRPERRSSSRRTWAVPACEYLETRTLLTGNLTANLAGSTLKITGDGGNHEIRIVGSAEGELTLTGINNTSINSVNNGSENFSNVKNISIDFGGGHCAVTFLTTDITGKLIVKAEGGNDKILFGEGNDGHNSFGKFFSLLGSGNNEVSVNDDTLSIPGTVKIVNGNGNNTVDLDPDVLLELGKTTVIGGSGSDFLDLGDAQVHTKSINVQSGDGANSFFLDGNVTVNGKITFTGGDSFDLFDPGNGGGSLLTVTKAVKVDLGNGFNNVEIGQQVVEFKSSVTITGGDARDVFDIDSDGIIFDKAFTLKLGAGNDEVDIDNALFRSAVSIDTGDGEDLVRIESQSSNFIVTKFTVPAKISLGNDDDEIDIGFNTDDFVITLASLTIDGGAGTNTLIDSGTNDFDSPPNLSGF